jgi:hypothetical protein
MLDEDAQFDASAAETSRPSGAIVARSCEPRPRVVLADVLEVTDAGK